MKLKRPDVLRMYSETIEALYEDHEKVPTEPITYSKVNEAFVP